MKYVVIVIVIVIVFGSTFPQLAIAQANPCSRDTTEQPIVALPKCINQIYTWALGAAALLAFLMIIIGGYFIMTAQGSGEQTTKGKEFIYSAIIGLVLLFTAYLLLRTINPDLVNFNLDSVNSTNQQSSP
ncbi:MAG: hypothetical protein HY545_02160 [Candidatus Doudnabacteria bacterium]|nr:hypothetical protein [Candidatus Doudnabacteria bacterium]